MSDKILAVFLYFFLMFLDIYNECELVIIKVFKISYSHLDDPKLYATFYRSLEKS